MKKPTTELGTKEMHKRHSVMVEGGTVPRSRVMDQTVIDKYLMKGLLTIAEHQAGELLMARATHSGIYAKAPDPDRVGSGGKPGNIVPSGIFPLGDTLDIVSRRYGAYAGWLVGEVVLHNMDISGDDSRMAILKKGLGLISERRMSGGNPVRHLKKK